jgi:hypothetical protein
LDLKKHGKQFEFEGVSLANLKENDNKNSKENVSDSKNRRITQGNQELGRENDQNSPSRWEQTRGLRSQPEGQNHHVNKYPQSQERASETLLRKIQ